MVCGSIAFVLARKSRKFFWQLQTHLFRKHEGEGVHISVLTESLRRSRLHLYRRDIIFALYHRNAIILEKLLLVLSALAANPDKEVSHRQAKNYEFEWAITMRIPRHADHHSELMSIMIPK